MIDPQLNQSPSGSGSPAFGNSNTGQQFFTGTFGHLAPLSDDTGAQALAVRGLHKSFSGNEVLHGISLDVPVGSFYGLVGPNGAGKTTMLSMVSGILPTEYGAIFVLGADALADPVTAKGKMGILADGMPTFDRLSGTELLNYVGLLHGIDSQTCQSRAQSLLSALELSGDANKAVVDYSAGMTKKILLACALIHAPRLLLLDEPLEAVDPVSSQMIRDILRDYVAQGGTVVMSSHVMELVEGLCDHVAVISEGAVRASGTIDQVREQDSLNNAFIRLVGGRHIEQGSLAWLNR